MAIFSKIEWTECTWNPVTGCTKTSPGCANCYAECMTRRLEAMGSPKYVNGFTPTTHEQILNKPLAWKRPRMVFVNSMSDLFHHRISPEFIRKVFHVMRIADQHQYQILTKRASRLARLSDGLIWSENIWMGVTVESTGFVSRIDRLRETGAKVKFLSLEPLLGPIPDLDLAGIDWVIVGGESGPRARPMRRAWVAEIRDQCLASGTPFFFKQWGGRNKKKAGRNLDGRTWDDMPPVMENRRDQLDLFG